jgi:hypothetical protein
LDGKTYFSIFMFATIFFLRQHQKI